MRCTDGTKAKVVCNMLTFLFLVCPIVYVVGLIYMVFQAKKYKEPEQSIALGMSFFWPYVAYKSLKRMRNRD